ncbi:MAG: ribonuclease H-like domain-containing protein [Blautia sp.]|nr:ribonuclease H-like domain-containing protein [Blautia sp.]
MKKIHKEEIYIRQDSLTDQLFDDRSLFFDIETTGFSPTNTSLYLIGCAAKREGHICIDQFFAETPSEEKEILQAFLALTEEYDTLISYNGIGFDVPYLKAKCDKYQLSESFKDFHYLDIFKSVCELKFLLRLPNYKQKTIEGFLKLPRDDEASGGELINVYRDYVKQPDPEALHLLLLHNYEDVLHMSELLPVLSYLEIFNGAYSILSTRVDAFHSYDGASGNELIITMENDYPVPRRISYKLGDFSLMISKSRTSIRVPVYEGELKYFYANYKDYYYLPKEDMAIHKSVSSFVDKEYRETARASNCYNRRRGSYLPQYTCIMQPEFRREYKDKTSYFELTEDFCSSDVMLRRYVDHILKYMFETKK